MLASTVSALLMVHQIRNSCVLRKELTSILMPCQMINSFTEAATHSGMYAHVLMCLMNSTRNRVFVH